MSDLAGTLFFDGKSHVVLHTAGYDVSDLYATVKPDLLFPQRVEIRFEMLYGLGDTPAAQVRETPDRLKVTLHALWSLTERRYENRRAEFESVGNVVITSALLREVPLQRYFERAIILPLDAATKDPWVPPADLETRVKQEPEANWLTDIARFYVTRRSVMQKPLAHMALDLGLSQSTITRYVKRARDAGLIDG